MAVRAFAALKEHTLDPNDDERVSITLRVTVFGDDYGTLETYPTYDLEIPDLGVGVLDTLRANLINAVISDLQTNSVPYNVLLDSVALYD